MLLDYILPATFDSLFGADSRHLARCIFLSDCYNQILYAFRVNYHYVTAYRADPKTLAGAPRRNSPRDYVWFTRLCEGYAVEPRLTDTPQRTDSSETENPDRFSIDINILETPE